MGRAGAQTVTNVRAAQRAGTKLVDVYYDLSGVQGLTKMEVGVSTDGGISYATLNSAQLTGDVGGWTADGNNKHFVWNAGIGWNELKSDLVRFRIRTSSLEFTVTVTTLEFDPDHPIEVEVIDPVDGNPVKVTMYCGDYSVGETRIVSDSWVFDGSDGTMTISFDDGSINGTFDRSTGIFELDYAVPRETVLVTPLVTYFSESSGHIDGVFDVQNIRFTGEEVIEEATSWSIDASRVGCLVREGIVGEGEWGSASEIVSPIISVDTSGEGDVTVMGQVLNGQNNLPLPGALVVLAGQSTSTAANGTFKLVNVNLADELTLTAGASGFASQSRLVQAAVGTSSVDVGVISLSPDGDSPIIEWAKPDVEGIFLAGFGLTPNLLARVNWNGSTPGSVEFRVNGTLHATLTGPGPEYHVSIPVDSALRTSLSATGNAIQVLARAQEVGMQSPPHKLTMMAVPVPQGLRTVVNSNLYRIFGPDHVGFDFELTKHEQKVTLPVVGTFGFEWGANASFDYSIREGEWEAALGLGAEGKKGKRGRRPAFPGLIRQPKAKLYIGNKEISASLDGLASGLAKPSTGIVLQNVGVSAGISTRLELTRYGLLDLFGPGLTNAFSTIPVVNSVLKNVSVIVWLIPGLEGSATAKVSPFSFDTATLTGRIGVEGAYEPEVGSVLKGRVYLGTDGAATFKLPAPVFQNVSFRLYGGYEFSAWVLKVSKEVVFVSYTYPSGVSAFGAPGAMDIGTGYRLEAAGNQRATWRAMDRPWRTKGKEVFLQGGEGNLRSLEGGMASPELELFARMGNLDAAGENRRGEGGIGVMVVDSDLPAQTELPLLGNVFPDSEPALASQGQNLMLLYVRDTGAPNPIHFTEAAWTFFDGTAWTTPVPVAGDVRGQFEPAVSFDGQGAAVAVWTRMKNAGFASEDLAEMAAQMEMVAARWDPVAKTWNAPVALTDNAFLDHKPRLAGPLTNGDLVLTWRENAGNQLIGSAAQTTRIMTRRWNAAAGTWGVPQELVPGLAHEFSVSLAARAGKAVLVLTRTMTGAEDLSDTELFFKIWDEGAGAWGPLTRHTTDAVADRNAQAAIGPNGDIYCVWQRGDDLVMDVDFSGNPAVVRPDSGTFGFSDLAVTVGPDGNVVVLWQEMSQHGSDAQYRVFDPASVTWGKDAFLSQDADLERSFAPVWDAAGNLTLAYNNVEIVKKTKSVVVEGGEVVEVEGVPQPGRVDLLLAKRQLVKDVTLVPEGLTADGTNFLPGDEVTLRARVRNAGNLAVQDLQVAFYDGDPDAGGVLSATEVIPGWLEAQDEVEVSHAWMVPQPVQARTVFVVVDPDNEVTEADESNNRLALPLNGVDLALEYQSGSALRDGSARVVVKVRNLSAPDSPVSMLKLKDLNSGVTLAETSVSQLAPGQSVDVPFDLPAGTQPEGDRAYVLVIDEEELVEDIDRENNEAPFALNLWIDDDGDGIPRWWELANGTSDDNEGDALLDLDGDGFNALQEFLAGTDPADRNSRLALGGQNVVEHVNGDPGTHSISWPSAAGRLYRLERSYDLEAWETVEENIEASPPLNQKLDTPGMTGKRVFYRVTVQ